MKKNQFLGDLNYYTIFLLSIINSFFAFYFYIPKLNNMLILENDSTFLFILSIVCVFVFFWCVFYLLNALTYKIWEKIIK